MIADDDRFYLEPEYALGYQVLSISSKEEIYIPSVLRECANLRGRLLESVR